MQQQREIKLKREQVHILTDNDLMIEGTLFHQQDIRLSDAVNAPAAQRDRPHLAVIDATVTRMDSGQEVLNSRFLLVSRSRIVIMLPKSELLNMPIRRTQAPTMVLKNKNQSFQESSLPNVAGPSSGFTPATEPTSAMGSNIKSLVRARIAEPPKTTEDAPAPRKDAPSSLERTFAETKTEVPALVQALKEKDESTRLQAFAELGRIGPDASAAVPALTDSLKDKNSAIREWAAVTLGKVGPAAKAAFPALVKLLDEREGNVRRQAVVAIGKIEPDPQGAVPILLNLLKEKDEFIREWAIIGLGNLGPEARTAVPALSEALQDTGQFVRRGAADALGKIGADAKSAIPALTAALKDEDVLCRHWASEALKRIQG